MTPREVAALLRCTIDKVRRLARDGVLPATRVGGEWRFERRRVRRHLGLDLEESA